MKYSVCESAVLSLNLDSERIDIAIDPFTGRNPSYCFVDLNTKEDAQRAMVDLDGKDMLGRPVKIKPGVARSSAERNEQQQRSPVGMDRWRRPEGASPIKTVADSDASQRVYVGGLPRVAEAEVLEAHIKTFFQGYNVYVFP